MPSRFLTRIAVVMAVMLVAVGSGCMEQLGRVQNARTGPGDAAVDFLSDAKYKKLVVEIDSVSGSDPNADALQKLKDALNAHLNKPGGITFDTTGYGSVTGKGKGAKYTWEEVDALEAEHRQRYAQGDTAVLYFLYLEGGSTTDSSNTMVLGAAYHGTSLVIFKGNIREASTSTLLNPRPSEACVERAVVVHELGHALGLVDNGIPMVRDHKDPDHPSHSRNKDSVMYYAVENGFDLIALFTGSGCNIPYQFDADDKADMKAAGGK